MAFTMSGASAGASVIGSMVTSFLSGRAEKKRIQAENAAKLAAWQEAVVDLREQLTTAYNRSEIELSEINRDKVTNKMAVRVAGGKAKGTAQVQAAQIGVAGRRGFRSITSEIGRQEADAINEIEVNTEIAFTNSVNAFNDTASAAIANLNRQRPGMSAGPSTMDMLGGSLNSGMDAYSKLSTSQQADLRSNFNFKSSATPEPFVSYADQVQIGGK